MSVLPFSTCHVPGPVEDSALIVKIVEPLHASEIEEVYLTAGEGVTDSRRCVGLCGFGLSDCFSRHIEDLRRTLHEMLDMMPWHDNALIDGSFFRRVL